MANQLFIVDFQGFHIQVRSQSVAGAVQQVIQRMYATKVTRSFIPWPIRENFYQQRMSGRVRVVKAPRTRNGTRHEPDESRWVSVDLRHI